jgi:hypothetical protein
VGGIFCTRVLGEPSMNMKAYYRLGVSCEERENHQAHLVKNVRESDLALLVKNEREANLQCVIQCPFQFRHFKGLLCQCFHANRFMKNVFSAPFGVSSLCAPFEELVHGSCIIIAQIFPLLEDLYNG